MANLARLMEEVGEFPRKINDKYGDKSKKVENEGNEIKMELGDLLYTIICIANSMDIELDEALKRVIDKYDDRDRNRWTE